MRYITLLLLLAAQTFACTGLKLTAKDGSCVHGRTAEFGVELDLSLLFIPRNFEFTGQTPSGPGLKYSAKYATIGVIAYGVPAVMDGLNEKGLSVGIFYFPKYAKYAENAAPSQSLSPLDFSNWLLTQCASLDDVRKMVGQISIVPTVFPQWGTEAPPFHYVVYDRTGASLVIEPIGGTLVLYDNKLGVITNSPTFDWHMTNLSNYVNLSPYNSRPLQIEGVDLAPFGQGSGLVGMPGDFSPPSRFVRAAIFSATATACQNSAKAILQGFHILNNFDIPVGTVRAQTGNVIHTDKTLATCMRDPQSLKFYFKTYDNQTIKVVDLSSFDYNGKELRKLNISGPQPIENVSAFFR